MTKDQLFKEFQQYYHGFFIHAPVGNNAFSFKDRRHKQIYVPSLIRGGLDEVKQGTEIVFSEIAEGIEKNSIGIENLVYWEHGGRNIFIADNHHHAFSFWSYARMAGILQGNETLVHVDQHKDTRDPQCFLSKNFWAHCAVNEICRYANEELNVGSFINPALKSALIDRLVIVDHEAAFDSIPDGNVIADIDLDVFASELDYISKNKKITYIRALIDRSNVITIATSPYFIDQEKALDVLKEIFKA